MIDLSDVSAHTQRQDSLLDQLSDLLKVANHLGMYDAADWLRRQLNERL